eukprot:603718-Prorocentrum_minimum.AAC.4
MGEDWSCALRSLNSAMYLNVGAHPQDNGNGLPPSHANSAALSDARVGKMVCAYPGGEFLCLVWGTDADAHKADTVLVQSGLHGSKRLRLLPAVPNHIPYPSHRVSRMSV